MFAGSSRDFWCEQRIDHSAVCWGCFVILDRGAGFFAFVCFAVRSGRLQPAMLPVRVGGSVGFEVFVGRGF
jgi:hypothetical protein